MRRLLARLGYLIARNRRDRELREEIEAHRQMVQDRLEAEGVAHADAVAGSRRAMGNVTLARESAREVWIVPRKRKRSSRSWIGSSGRGQSREAAYASPVRSSPPTPRTRRQVHSRRYSQDPCWCC